MAQAYHYLLITQLAFALLVFIILFFVSAPYGRFLRKGWGITMPSKYGWLIMEFPAAATIAIMFFLGNGPSQWHLIVFLLIWESHYLRRTFVYPFQMKNGNKPYPVILVIFAIIFNSINGYINGYYLFYQATIEMSWFTDPRFIIGLGLFYFGYYINLQSDTILSNLRKPGETGYKIPFGGFFRYVSSPHYFGEIIEWTGWAILTWSLPGLAFALFTFANLAPRAVAHHAWYKDTFEAYPRERKAIIPGIW